MTEEDLDMLRKLCIFMINWSERDPESILPDVIPDDVKEELLNDNK